MDCNREEALRAKEIAEKKMESKDFSGALKVATKAQQLYPQLENVSQMIVVCEVHISSEKKSFGSDKDWYGILKIEPSADDISIKKQYRKLALILHPDKNKFSGSADAFKLIGEAQRVLLDRERRLIHDSKRRAFGNVSTHNRAPKQSNRQPQQHPWNSSQQSQFQNNFPAARPVNHQFAQQRGQTGFGQTDRVTFWTVCPFCLVRYQFFKDDVLNKVIHCQSCKKSFTAYEAPAHTPATGFNPTHQPPLVPKHNNVSSSRGPDGNFTTRPVFSAVNLQENRPSKSQGNLNRKRKKIVEESSSEDNESGSESEEEDVEEEENSETSDEENNTEERDFKPKNGEKNPIHEDFQRFGEPPRRSSRAKRNVSYKENVNDLDNDNEDDTIPPNPPKKKEIETSSIPTEPKVKKETFWKEEVTKVVKEDKEEEDDIDEEREPESEEAEPEVYECPDPDFTDFDKEKKEENFKVGQIWAAYDTEDAMPRFYAFIRKVESPGFNLHITWLIPVPETEDEKIWESEDLPISCGKFRRGKTDKALDLPMFSHLVTWEATSVPKGLFNIVPRKGQTWALFRNWSIEWESSETRKYEYDFVEILSDYDEKDGVQVSYLEKVKGFTCLFNPKEDGGIVIPADDKYRFSHMVPSCRMSGVEREGVPKGSYELDPASLPASTFEQVNL